MAKFKVDIPAGYDDRIPDGTSIAIDIDPKTSDELKEKAVQDYLDSRYGPKTHGVKPPAVKPHSDTSTFAGRFASVLPPKSETGIIQGLKRGLSALNPLNSLPPRPEPGKNYPVPVQGVYPNSMEGVKTLGPGETEGPAQSREEYQLYGMPQSQVQALRGTPIVGDIARLSAGDVSGEAAQFVPALGAGAILGGVAASPKVRAAGRGFVRGIAENPPKFNRYTPTGVLGAAANYFLHDPTYAGAFKGMLAGSAGEGIAEGLYTGVKGAFSAAKDADWLSPSLKGAFTRSAEFVDPSAQRPVNLGGGIIDIVPRQIEGPSQFQPSEPIRTSGAIPLSGEFGYAPNLHTIYPPNVGPAEFETYRTRPDYPPGTAPENASPTSLPVLPAAQPPAGLLAAPPEIPPDIPIHPAGEPIITPPPAQLKQIEGPPIITPPPEPQDYFERTYGVKPITPTKPVEKPQSVNKTESKVETKEVEPPKATSPEEMIDKLKSKPVKPPGEALKDNIERSKADKTVESKFSPEKTEFIQKQKEFGLSEDRAAQLYEDELKEKDRKANAKSEETEKTEESSSGESEDAPFSHEEIGKLADAIGTNFTATARWLIKNGYEVQASKFGGKYGLDRPSKRGLSKDITEEQAKKINELIDKKKKS
jgi:hypothetical protein